MRFPKTVPLMVALMALCLSSAVALEAPQPLDIDEVLGLMELSNVSDEFLQYNEIVLFDHTLVEFESSGAYKQYSHSLLKVLTDEGADTHGDESFVYHRRYMTHEVLLARIIKTDGTVVEVGEDLISDGTPPQMTAIGIYESDFREKTVIFPGLEIGDAIEMITLEDAEPLIENGFTGTYFFQYVGPILDASVTITGPSDMPLKHAVLDGEAGVTETTEGSLTTYVWRITDSDPLEPEIGMVSFAQIATRLSVSTFRAWSEISRFAFALMDDKCVADDTVTDLLHDVTDGLDTTEEKITAIHYWVMENIRYLGIAMDRGAFLEPHLASYTIEKEYGICRDKAVLMVTMLKEIGVPAWVVLINPGRRTDREIPSVGFEHGIVAIEDGHGGYRYFDPTLDNHREIDASYIGDRWVLLATEEGQDLRQTPHVTAYDNSGDIVDDTTLGEDGAISGSVTVSGRGIYEMILRKISASASEEEIRMMWDQLIQEIYPGAELTSFVLGDHADLYEPMQMELEYTIEDYALDADPYLLFRVPASTGAFDFLSGLLVGRLTSLPERKYPLTIGATIGASERSLVIVPDGYTVESLPDEVHYEQGPVSLSITYEFIPASDNGGAPAIRYDKTYGIASFELEPDEYLALKEASRLASRSARGEVILKKEEG